MEEGFYETTGEYDERLESQRSWFHFRIDQNSLGTFHILVQSDQPVERARIQNDHEEHQDHEHDIHLVQNSSECK